MKISINRQYTSETDTKHKHVYMYESMKISINRQYTSETDTDRNMSTCVNQ